jgi:hypothetical protein
VQTGSSDLFAVPYNSIAPSEGLPLLTPDRMLEALALGRGVSESRWGSLLREGIRGLTP